MIPRSQIRSALRKVWWMYGGARKEALKRAKMGAMRGYYRCEACHLPTKKPDVDHVTALGVTPGSKLDFDGKASWHTLIERLFCAADGLRVLCKSCHSNRTKSQKSKEAS